MEKILTIIIPTYNMEAYLHKCVDSLIMDDQLMELLEVLIVNDGSTDKTSAMAHDYELRFPDSIRVIDKENGHYGSCVNRGLVEAMGKYVKILDADDWFDTNVLGDFLKFLHERDEDMIISDYHIVNTEGKVKRAVAFDLPQNTTKEISDFCAKEVFGEIQMHAVAYKKDILIANNYMQTEGLPYTDKEWLFLPVTYMKTFVYFPYALYNYMLGRKGQTVNLDIYHRRVGDRIVGATKMLSQFIEIKDKIPAYSKIFLRRKLMSRITNIYKTCILINRDASPLELFDQRLREQDGSIYEEMNKREVHWLFKYEYVRQWRETQKMPPLIVSLIYRTLQRMKHQI